MTAAETLRDTLQAMFPPPAWAWSFERLIDGAEDATKRYGVIKSAGGTGGDVVRAPLLTVDLIGKPGGDTQQTARAAETAVAALRESSGPVAIFEPGEPVPSESAEGRPIYTIAVAATLIDD